MRFMQLKKICVVFKICQSYEKQKHLLLQRNLNKIHLLHTPLNFLIKIPCEYIHFTDVEFLAMLQITEWGLFWTKDESYKRGSFGTVDSPNDLKTPPKQVKIFYKIICHKIRHFGIC